ncbi:MAG: hypothetical protein ACK5PZ_15650 [Pirellula sp.]
MSSISIYRNPVLKIIMDWTRVKYAEIKDISSQTNLTTLLLAQTDLMDLCFLYHQNREDEDLWKFDPGLDY